MKKTQLKRKTPLKKSSQKRAKEMALYRKERDAFLASGWFCPVMFHIVGLYVPATKIHHKKQRHGKLLRDQRFWLPVSADGYRFIHNNSRLAREKGWLI